ncbi:1-acyl-sn-glycerol-3-phosphate acyltransferase [Microcoleus sp. FACHB-1515]|uniref:1-acyl-sn-glycerol-3-phosphate acyltransferase n=1 Tax=Cyanophyceae TaxID=3028117 RepID=UPI00168597E8|nr:1-acyl-sn-glycerol-3-phosphate acyltransferase [Microcoleus sp. FACHB-1515]MBD2092191.1 1-acyl-sn-glycerol-3-phosphate acyltransferase [Microcoleus sp. FACHB-1515]
MKTTLTPLMVVQPAFGDRWSWFDRFCLWYPPAWLILFNRHWQHYHDDPDGWNWLEYALFLVPAGFYVALLIRWLRLGCRSPRPSDQPVDLQYQQAFRDEILVPIVDRYFRAELHQAENLPAAGSILVTLNHAGMCFPWDFIALGVLLGRERDWTVQPVAHELFFDHPWLRWWLPSGWSQVLGGVRAEREPFAEAIATLADTPNQALLYAPEGWRGLAKGWRHRYQLTTFDPSFVRLCDRHQVPILPTICIGSENLHPFTVNLAKLGRWLKLPLFPISPLVVAFVLFPSLGVWAVRSRLHYFIQPIERLDQDSFQSTSDAYAWAQRLRSKLQAAIDRLRQ